MTKTRREIKERLVAKTQQTNMQLPDIYNNERKKMTNRYIFFIHGVQEKKNRKKNVGNAKEKAKARGKTTLN